MLSHHLLPKKLLEAIEGNYVVHCVQILPSNGSEGISSKPFWCCFIFCLFLLHLGQSVEKLKGDESMKVSFGFTEAWWYFTSKSLFHLFIYFYLKSNWDSLLHSFAPLRKSDFSVSYSEQPARETATPHDDLRVFTSEAATLCPRAPSTKSIRKAKADSEIQGQTPSSHSVEWPFAQLRNALGERQDFFS